MGWRVDDSMLGTAILLCRQAELKFSWRVKVFSNTEYYKGLGREIFIWVAFGHLTDSDFI